MTKLAELRIMTWLRLMVKEHRISGKITDQQVYAFEDEQEFLLNEFKKKHDEDAWWSDEEWDWFINRCLDFLGVPK